MPRVREGVDKGVTGDSLPNPERRVKRGIGIIGQRGRQEQRSQTLQIGVSRIGRT